MKHKFRKLIFSLICLFGVFWGQSCLAEAADSLEDTFAAEQHIQELEEYLQKMDELQTEKETDLKLVEKKKYLSEKSIHSLSLPTSDNIRSISSVSLDSGVTEIAIPGVYSGAILEPDSSNFYHFILNEPLDIKIALNNLPGDYDLHLLNSNKESISASMHLDLDDEEIICSLEPGEYFIQVYSMTDYSQENYGLTVDWTTIQLDQFESNNSLSQAYLLDTSTVDEVTVDANISFTGDEDLYKFEDTDRFSLMFVSLTNIPVGTDFDLQVLDASGTVLGTSEKAGQLDEVLSVPASNEDVLYVRVFSQYGDWSNDEYALNIKLTNYKDEYEPNDRIGQAKTINTEVQGTIDTIDDNDFFKFEVLSTYSLVTANLTNLPHDFDLYLTDGIKYLKFSVHDGLEDENLVQVLPAGTYYLQVKVHSAETVNYGPEFYTLSLEQQPVAIEADEPNDTTSSGLTVDNDTYIGYLSHTLDKDFYKIQFTEGKGTLTVDLTNIPGDYRIVLLDANNRLLQATIPSQSNQQISTTIELGTYYLVVDSPSGHFSNLPYTLTFNIEGTQIATGWVNGTVRLDKSSNHSGVTVSIDGYDETAVTSVSGYYYLTGVPVGTKTIRFSAPGYLSCSQQIDVTSMTNVPTVELKAGDVNGDNIVDIFDFYDIASLLNYDNTSPKYSLAGDYNRDGIVDIFDVYDACINLNTVGS